MRRERGVGDGWPFASIELREPSKADLPAREPGRLTRREALVVCWDRADGRAYRAVVSLTGDSVTDWEHLPGRQPNMTVDEWHECDEMIRAHPAVAEALGRRGITDLSRVLADMWAYGAALVPERLRSVAHRLSFAEMVVPYRDASPDHYRRTAFDIGEWGLGFMTTSLSLGCDCLGEITYLDAVVHDSRGEPVTIPNAICIHEEDGGVLWKHVDEQAGAEVRRHGGWCSPSTLPWPTTSTWCTGASTRTAASSARSARPGSVAL